MADIEGLRTKFATIENDLHLQEDQAVQDLLIRVLVDLS